MTIFERELRKLFEDGRVIVSPHFSGRACLGTVSREIQARAELVTTGIANEYDALRITLLNRREGMINGNVLLFQDLWGRKPVPGNPSFPEGIAPHIWVDRGIAQWYAWKPGIADYDAIRSAVREYLEPFRDRAREQASDGPRLVYICAPLRGEAEKNIEFARQKAREVFSEGNIPVCPHLLFPPIADPENPIEDQKARDMGLRLLEVCQQVNVYGRECTDGMWAEIQQATRLGIEVEPDRETERRSAPRRSARKRQREER